MATQLKMDERDDGWIIYYSVRQTQASLLVNKDHVKDNDRNHAQETWRFLGTQRDHNPKIHLSVKFESSLSLKS